MGRVSLFVLSLAILCAIQLKLHVCEDALTRKLQQKREKEMINYLIANNKKITILKVTHTLVVLAQIDNCTNCHDNS